MSTPLQPVITKAGLAAIWNASRTGLAAEITHIGLGSAGYTPNSDQKVLRTLVEKYPVSGGEQLSSTLIHLTAIADDSAAFWVREVGFFLDDGTLFAVWSSAGDPLTYKSANTDLLLAYDLSLEALPANSVTIKSSATGLNLTLAAPLAAQAAALIAEQLRGVLQQDQLDAQARQQRITQEQQHVTSDELVSLLQRLKAAEQQQSADRENQLVAIVANATGLISLQHLFSQKTLGV